MKSTGVAVLALGCVQAFQHPAALRLAPSQNVNLARMSSVNAPAETEVATKKRLHVQLGEKVVDLTGWRAKHPAGPHWIDRFQNRDATDVFTAFHSDKAMEMVQKMPAVKGSTPAEPSEVTKNFRAFRAKLVEDGWFKRKPLNEAFNVLANLGTYAYGFTLIKTNPVLATLVLGVAHTTGGWVSHDSVHGRGPWCNFMRCYGALMCGLNTKWWSEKHNLHHACTNEIGIDEDIMVEPFIYLWTPNEERDRPWRKFQALYWPIPFSFTFALWRFDSLKTVFKLKLWKDWKEGPSLMAHYIAMLAFVPLPIAIGHILVGGLLTATIVTVTHTAEEYLLEESDSYVDTQFRTTRDAICRDPVSEYIWGGMQYQLEHHLFPTMPRYRYPALVPLVKQFAKENNLEYRETGQWKIIADNVKLLKNVASNPVEGSSPSPFVNPRPLASF